MLRTELVGTASSRQDAMSRKRVRTPSRELRLPGRFGCRSKLNRFRHHARGSRLSSCVQIRIGASISVRHQYGKSETDLKREGARCANARTLGKRFVVFQPHTGFTMGEKSRSEEITIFASYRDSPGMNFIGSTQCNNANVARIWILFRIASPFSFKLFCRLRIFRPGVAGQNGGFR